LGNPQISFENIVQACQIAGADEFISNLPEKYQTVLGEFGSNLSGGQRQRLALARGIVNNPPVLILDESTSALDPVSEAEVLQSLMMYRQGKSTIIISHRPRVIQRADWIVMLKEGRLHLQGSLQDLSYRPGEHLQFLMA
jgi:ABC-type bacteriocin/lantibiotic exporter with double-glycine peptidase domain